MRKFKMNSLDEWKNLAQGEAITYKTETGGVRRKLRVLSSHHCFVLIRVNDEEPKVIAAGDGLLETEFAYVGEATIEVQGLPKAAAVTYQTDTKDYSVKVEKAGASFTELEPGSMNLSQSEKMMMLMHANYQKLQQQVADMSRDAYHSKRRAAEDRAAERRERVAKEKASAAKDSAEKSDAPGQSEKTGEADDASVS